MSQLHVAAKIYHHASGNEIHEVRFQELEPGMYSGTTQLVQAGLWQLDLRMEGDQGIAGEIREVTVN